MTAPDDFVATTEVTAAVAADWAGRHGLAYERVGLLPAASPGLSNALGLGSRYADGRTRTSSGGGPRRDGALIRSPMRPERFSENLCSGRLPGGLEGTLAHHTYIHGEGDGGEHRATGFTVVVAFRPDAARVCRSLVGRVDDGTRTLAVAPPDPGYGPLLKPVDATPTLGDRWRWTAWVEDDETAIAAAFDAPVLAALDAAAGIRTISVMGGMLVVETERHYVDEPAKLDALAQVAAAVAGGLSRSAARLPRLEPGPVLPAPADTRLRRWVVEGAARVAWSEPPPDVDSAVQAYAAAASAGEPSRQAASARVRILAVFLLIAVLIGGLTFATSGPPGGIAAFVIIMMIGVFAAVRRGTDVFEETAAERAEAWGLEAFAAGYAQRHGLVAEDREELRRRLAWPFPGYPERCMRGQIAAGSEGRLMLWRDPSQPAERSYSNVALVPAPRSEPQARPRAPLDAHRVDDWLVVREQVDRTGRSAERLGALAAEEARCARPAGAAPNESPTGAGRRESG